MSKSKMSQNVSKFQNSERRDYIRNQHEKCIQIGTTIPSIGLASQSIGFEIEECCDNKHTFEMEETLIVC